MGLIMKYFSMFSGIGGFELGIQCAFDKQSAQIKQNRERGNRAINQVEHNVLPTSQAAPLCIGFSEIDKYAIQIYKKHFPEHKEYGDVSKIKWDDVEDFDLVCSGFPCQAFSIAGKRKGFIDTRGTLFFEIARVLKKKQPRLLLLENVKGLLSHDKGRTFGVILNTLDELGYDLQWQVLNSKNFGVPQNRERVFIVGHLRGTSRPEVFPIGEADNTNNKKPVSTAIDSNYWKGIDNHGQRTAIVYSYPHGGFKGGKKKLPNLRAHSGAIHNEVILPQIRRLTPTECERLQGFPDGWTEGVSDTQRYKCLGNAVTVNVIEAIMKEVSWLHTRRKNLLTHKSL